MACVFGKGRCTNDQHDLLLVSVPLRLIDEVHSALECFSEAMTTVIVDRTQLT